MKKIGLVLSGGGVRGVAQIGALQAMHELGIHPNIVSGTSAGSIVGAMYAAGHPLDMIFDFFRNTPIFKASHFATFKPGLMDSDKFIPVLKEFFPEDDFAALRLKCYVTATDIIKGKSRTFSSGEIIRPILASCAVPVVFTPVKIGETLYTDGGALNNFPVEPLIGQCDTVIGIDIHPLKEISPKEIRNVLAVMERMTHLSVYYHSVGKHHLCNLTIAPKELSRFGLFDRIGFDEMFEIGYQATIDRSKALLQLLKH